MIFFKKETNKGIMFFYWETVLNLKISIFIYVFS